jgi:hypothetical protein
MIVPVVGRGYRHPEFIALLSRGEARELSVPFTSRPRGNPKELPRVPILYPDRDPLSSPNSAGMRQRVEGRERRVEGWELVR